MTTSCGFIRKKVPEVVKTALDRQQSSLRRWFFSSLHESSSALQVDMKDDYVARQFGYRVVPSFCYEGYTSVGEAFNTAASTLDILSSPEVKEILKSQQSQYDTSSCYSSVPPAEAHVDNGYSSDNDFPNDFFSDDHDY